VAVGAVAALTLVPALLGLAGRRIDRLRVCRPAAEASATHAGWARYAATVGAHPWRFLLAGVLFLGVLAIPLLSLQLGHVDAGADPASYSDKQGLDPHGHDQGLTGPVPYWTVDDINEQLRRLVSAGRRSCSRSGTWVAAS
jgi:RND superfamily putative drug exporter